MRRLLLVMLFVEVSLQATPLLSQEPVWTERDVMTEQLGQQLWETEQWRNPAEAELHWMPVSGLLVPTQRSTQAMTLAASISSRCGRFYRTRSSVSFTSAST